MSEKAVRLQRTIEKADEEKHGITRAKLGNLYQQRSEYYVGYVSKDPLTGAASQLEFNTQLEHSIKMVRRETPAALVYIDIDKFKSVNDTYGHDAGDAVLKQVCSFIMSSVRETDLVARLHGDELAVLLEGSNGDSERLAENLRAGIEKLKFDEYPGIVTASFGVVSLDASVDADATRKRADKALYEAKGDPVKKDGRNRVRVYSGT